MRLPLNIHRDSAEAMRVILSLHFPSGSILDVNYGLGTFYLKVQREVVGIDLRSVAPIIADNRHLPFAADSFAVGVCDPPFHRGKGDTKYIERYGLAPYTAKRVSQQYYELLPELLRVARDGIIIKAQDESDGHRFYHRMFSLVAFIKDLTGLLPHDIAYLVKSGVMDNVRSDRDRHFMANCISYFLIYRWSQKAPFKPVRFNRASENREAEWWTRHTTEKADEQQRLF